MAKHDAAYDQVSTPAAGTKDSTAGGRAGFPAVTEVANATEKVGAAKEAIAKQIGLHDTVKVADGSTEVYGNGFRGN